MWRGGGVQLKDARLTPTNDAAAEVCVNAFLGDLTRADGGREDEWERGREGVCEGADEEEEVERI